MLVEKLLSVAEIGSQVVLYVLLGLSVISIGVIIERIWYFAKRKVDTVRLGKDLLKKLEAGDRAGAEKLLRSSRGIEPAIVADALAWFDKGPEAVQEILQNGVREKRKEYESGLLFLGTLGNNAPFIGLFGTVLGIVTAFRELGTTTAQTGAAGNMNNVMGGIAEALVATAVGILVALPAVIAYNNFQKKSGDVEEKVAALGNLVVATMKGEAHKTQAVAPVAGKLDGRKGDLHPVREVEA
jgi:biopolymer transport protein ExbB/biopolymer transport protein TolQ